MTESELKKLQAERGEPPAMGERRARWGYGYQDKVATSRILDILRAEIRKRSSSFEGVRLADLDAWRVDDFVLVWNSQVEGYSIKWSGSREPMNWGDLIGVDGLLKELATGYQRLSERWTGRAVAVQLLSNRPASTERHPAQLIGSHSVAEFLETHWSQGPKAAGPDVSAVWQKIREHVGLGETDFAKFVQACRVRLGFPDPSAAVSDASLDAIHYRRQFESLHKEIATWLTNHPSSEEIPREYLLHAIGVRTSQSGLIQQFPSPQIPYKQNETASRQVKQVIESTSGGYLAITGPAGVGKSTLVQDVLSGYPLFVPYYAYLPNGEGNPRDRGDSLVFFQDVVLRLDGFFEHRSSIGISDVAEGREALKRLMKKASEFYAATGQKTILLIDGLDHVTREVDLQRPVQRELPTPEEIPEGFLIILSSQPQALLPGVLERHAAGEIQAGSDRRIEVDGLNLAEVHAIVLSASENTSGSERDSLFQACKGNPLILTYLLNLLRRTPAMTVDQVIAAAGDYQGDISKYYESSLVVPLREPEIRNVLALLSRAAPTLPLNWTLSWPERAQVEQVYETVLAAFLRFEEGNVYFIHNSLIAFLREETRSKIPGADLERQERNYHSLLAERCGDASCVDPLGRAKVLHLMKSGQHQSLLALLSSNWLRRAINEFLPYSEVRVLILYGLVSAWQLADYSNVLRLILLDFELGQRSSRMSAGEMARRLLKLDRTTIAVSQIRSFGRILAPDEEALPFAGNLREYADSSQHRDLADLADEIYRQVKPVRLFFHGDPIDTEGRSGPMEILRSWVEWAPLFESANSILEQFDQVRFSEPLPHSKTPAAVKAELLELLFVNATHKGWPVGDYRKVLDAISKLGETGTLFSALMLLYGVHPSSELLAEIEDLYLRTTLNVDVHLRFSELLFEAGKPDEARSILSRLRHLRFDYFHNEYGLEMPTVSYTIRLSRLQALLGVEEGPLPGIENEREEAVARVEAVARQIGNLSARVLLGQPTGNLREIFRALLLFHNRPLAFSKFDWHQNYIVTQMRPAIYSRVIHLAFQIGGAGLEALRDVFLELVNGPAGGQFPAHYRRQFARTFFENKIMDSQSAAGLALSSAEDTQGDDPVERLGACLDVAEFLHETGNEGEVDTWLLRASKVSAGAGSHKDYHMAQLAEWLALSLAVPVGVDELKILEKFVRAVEVAGGAGASSATSTILQSLMQIDTARASSLATELIDRDVVNISDALESLLEGGAKATASPSLLLAAYSEMLTLIQPGDTSSLAVAILRRYPSSERAAVAETLLASVRTNALPSRRAQIARTIQDALRSDGIGEFSLAGGLKRGADDSSRTSSLYKLSSGEVLTSDAVAARLSDPDDRQSWNSNPSENESFDWWEAISKSNVRDRAHLDALLSTFSIPDYRSVHLLAWKSQQLRRFGDDQAAEVLVDDALSKAEHSSWFERWDGAQLRKLYATMARFDDDAISKARHRFGEDLTAGRLHNMYLLDEIGDLLRFFNVEWPHGIIHSIEEYVDDVLSANRAVPEYSSLTRVSDSETADQAICRFAASFLGFPTIDVGVAARRALARYAAADGAGLEHLLLKGMIDGIQLEHLLACIEIGLRAQPNGPLRGLESYVRKLNGSPSIGTRAVARRICAEQDWQWDEVENIWPASTLYLPHTDDPGVNVDERARLLGADSEMAFDYYGNRIARFTAPANDSERLWSDFHRAYLEVEKEYRWADERAVARWVKLALTRSWLRNWVIVGREAAMRVIGTRGASGPPQTRLESSYDLLSPIYDPAVELLEPVERPRELIALEWDSHRDEAKEWRNGEGANDWSSYPKSICDLHIIGERTHLYRPDWETPREDRYRGLVNGSLPLDATRGSLASRGDLTYQTYLDGVGQQANQLVVFNSAEQVRGKMCRWMAVNSSFARSLGWSPSEVRPFTWVDSSGAPVVQSLFWRDGWSGLEPPRFESLGEGWIVLATTAALAKIREKCPGSRMHLWVLRESHGEKPHRNSWHLERSRAPQFF